MTVCESRKRKAGTADSSGRSWTEPGPVEQRPPALQLTGFACWPQATEFASISIGVVLISSLLERKIEKRPDRVRLEGRILFLTEDPELIKRQLAGEDLPWDTKNPATNPKLRDDISTDEITPAHYCFYFDETLGEIPYLGLKCGTALPISLGVF